MIRWKRGEVWLVDLGLAAKIRPCLILSVAVGDNDRSVATVVAHTTALRGNRFEAPLAVRFLKTGAFSAQGLISVTSHSLIRRLGVLSPSQLKAVESTVSLWLGLANEQGD